MFAWRNDASLLRCRPRRLRQHAGLRRLVSETSIDAGMLIYPVFVSETATEPEPVRAMPGIYRWPTKQVADEVGRAKKAGVGGVLLFGLPRQKDPEGSEAARDDGVVQRAIRAIKDAHPDVLVMTDVCLCAYTDHGHCGVVATRPGRIDLDVANDPTLDRLAAMAITHARAGADVVAPSAMMDGQVGAIRYALDAAGYEQVGLMAYSVKYASAFYGPFREAAASAPGKGDRTTYQMDPANFREALREVALDVREGADLVMVKPALAYLDVIRAVREQVQVPVAAYNVSGEYSMVKAAAQAGWMQERAVVLESLTAMARAGADVIITYHAVEAAHWLAELSQAG